MIKVLRVGHATFTTPDLPGALTGVSPFSFLGSQPSKQSSLKTPFRPDVPCETQDPPNLNSDIGPAPATNSSGKSATTVPPAQKALVDRYATLLTEFARVRKLRSDGSLPAAKQLMTTLLPQFAAWSKDWAAFQKANGIDSSAPPLPAKKAGR